MVAATPLRSDFSATDMRVLARASKDANQTRRLLALASIYDGGSRRAAAKVGGVTAQIIRDWVVRFNARGPDGLLDGKAPGRVPKLNEAQRQALVELIERGPIPAIDEVVRWRLKDLVQWVYREYRISIDESTLGRMLKAMGYRKLSARPHHHAQNELQAEHFKKKLPGTDRRHPMWPAGRHRDRAVVAG